MSDPVPADQIEAIVGRPRHATDHYARAISSKECVYVLHSAECLTSTPDLRDCPYSIALDRGIECAGGWRLWRRVLDRPVRVQIIDGHLLPELLATR